MTVLTMCRRWLCSTESLAVAGLLLVLTSGVAGAQQQPDTESANFMLPHCKRVLLVERGKGTFTEGRCAGSIISLVTFERILGFCSPESVTNEQVMRVVVAYIEARPARMHEDYRNLALEALREAWPCR